MKFSRGLAGVVTVILLGSAAVPLLSPAASPAVVASCRSADHPALAAELARDIDRALRGRVAASEAGAVAVGVDAPGQGVQCWLDSSAHFDSASVVKVIILGA